MQNLPLDLQEAIARESVAISDTDERRYPHLYKPVDFSAFGPKACACYRPKAVANPYQYLGRLAAELRTTRNDTEAAEQRYKPWAGTYKAISNLDLNALGWVKPNDKRRDTVTRLAIAEWVDMETGELISTAELRQKVKATRGAMPGTGSTSERFFTAALRVAKCKPSERGFVSAVLRMRNYRGGLLVDLKTLLDRWIALKHPTMRTADKARKRAQLERVLSDRRILANPQTLHKDLQITGNTDKGETLAEAGLTYRVVPVQGTPGGSVPHWFEVKELRWLTDEALRERTASAWNPSYYVAPGHSKRYGKPTRTEVWKIQ